MQVKIEIANLDKIQKALNDAPEITARHIDQAIKRSIYLVWRAAVPLTPVDTGRLRTSYDVTFEPLKGIIEPTADYAYWVHEGTGRMQARPFLMDGIESSLQDMQNEFDNALEKALNEIVK